MFYQDIVLPKKSNYENVSAIANEFQLKTCDPKSRLGVKKITKTECCVDHGLHNICDSKIRLDHELNIPNNDVKKVVQISKLDFSLVNVVQNSICAQVSTFICYNFYLFYKVLK